jgi:exosortase N
LNITASYPLRSIARLNWSLVLLLTLGLAGGIAAFPRDYLMAANVLVGLCLFPFALFIDGKTRVNYVYLAPLAIFAVLSYQYDIKIFYFFGLAFYVLFILEFFIGRVNTLILFLVAVASPVFTQISVILSFPIRLVLSDWACTLLSLVGLDIRADGNMILLSGYSFTVDEACMGLSMLAISLLMGIFIIVHHYKLTGHKLSFLYLLLFFSIVFCLNIITNLLRIMLLVLFRILPENAMHEVVGILCLVFYTMIPLYFLGRWIIRWKGTLLPGREQTIKTVSKRSLLMLLLVAMAVTVTGFSIDAVRTDSEAEHARVSMPNMVLAEIDGGITKLTNNELLIYVKPIPEFFTGEHTPLICWKGSGFLFKQVKKDIIAGRQIFTGTLIKDNTQLYTAWWYTDGEIETINQVTWRSKMLITGNDFCLVNVTASDEHIIQRRLKEILTDRLLKVE